MPFVEDDRSLRANAYTRSLNYTYDRSLQRGRGAFHYVFNEGGLSCSRAATAGNRMCLVSRREQSQIRRQRPNFVYVDHGCWVDNADGNGTRRRDFALICGPHAYVCSYAPGGGVPRSRIPSVQQFFRELSARGGGVRVYGYATARPPMSSSTPTDPNLYLFLADLHLPPVSWFYRQHQLVGLSSLGVRNPPSWLSNLPAMRRQPHHLMRNYYSLAQRDRERSHLPTARGPVSGNPDIFLHAGRDLVRFLGELRGLSAETKRRLHFIQTGDMFELWLGRDYQFAAGRSRPRWLDSGSVNRVSDWALEVIIQNTPVIDAFRRLERAGLAEVKYLWGNHDAYLKDPTVTTQLGLAQRDPTYTGLNNDLFSEHGHRFDRSNHDNTSAWSGPAGANAAFYIPVFRTAEPLARTLTSIGHPSTMRDCYLLGATLIYLHTRYDRGSSPFSIYVMGHSHDRKLFSFNIGIRYHLYAQP